MKKITAIILFVLCLLEVTGLYGVFLMQRYVARKEMKNWLHTFPAEAAQSYSTFVFHKKSALPAWENDHEFLYQGNMYDLIGKKQAGDSVIIICISDKKENALVQQFAGIYGQQNHGTPSSREASLIKLIFTPYIWQQTFFNFAAPAAVKVCNRYKEFPLPTFFSRVVLPPPQCS